jgi:MFS family permease
MNSTLGPSAAKTRFVVATIGATQAIAWASSFYLPSVLAKTIAPDLGLSPAWVFGGLSLALGVSGLLAPRAGSLIDEFGGRPVLCSSNVISALGLVLLALARGPVGLLASWCVLGLAMAGGLYEAAFASLTRIYGSESRGAITGVTLIAGFASTIGWPTSAYLAHVAGWRGACLSWAAIQLAVSLPLNALALRGAQVARAQEAPGRTRVGSKTPDRRMWILAFMFTTSGVVSIGVATLMPTLLLATGASATAAIAAASLMGPAQVGARIVEYSARKWIDPLISARIANALHPIGALILAVFGAPAIAVFSVVHGAGNGILTIAKGTLPLAIFGAEGYGARIGKLSAPARVGQALAPLLLGLAIERFGLKTLLLSGLLSGAALLSLFSPELKER